MLALGAAVRSRRTELGFTLKALGLRAQVSERFLVQLEGGSGNISVARLLDVADALGTSPAALLAVASRTPPAIAQHIALVGLRGAGKSTIGLRLAAALGVAFVELDAVVARETGMSLATIFEVHGESWFHRAEKDALHRLLMSDRPTVIATGGSLVKHASSWTMLREHALTVWLKASADDHWNRVVAQGDGRPMRGRPEAMTELKTLLRERRPLYALAEAAIDTSSMSLEEAVEQGARIARRERKRDATAKGSRR